MSSVRNTKLLSTFTALALCVLAVAVASAPALGAGAQPAPVAAAAKSGAKHKHGKHGKHRGAHHSFKARRAGKRVACRVKSAAKRRALRKQGRCAARKRAARRDKAAKRPAKPSQRDGSGAGGSGSGGNGSGDSGSGGGSGSGDRRSGTPRTSTPRTGTPRTGTPRPSDPAPPPSDPAPVDPAPSDPAPADPGPSTPGSANGYNGWGVNNWPGGDWRPFAASSPWNQPVGGAAVHPSSSTYVQTVLGWNRVATLLAGLSGTTNDYGHPTYFAQPDDPIFTLSAAGSRNELQGMRIRVPDAAKAAGGSDGHMTIVEPDGWVYDLWQVRSKPSGGGTLTYSIGGRSRIDGTGTDGRATAANFPNLAGIIRAQELAAGRIDHALFMVIRCTSGTTAFGYGTKPAPSSSQSAYVYPASHGGSRCEDPNVPPMGTRFQLAMSTAQIDALSVPNWKKTMLQALATYGAYVGDTGGSGFGFQFESGATYTSFGVKDPMVTLAQSAGMRALTGEWAGTYPFEMNSGVDWARYLRVVAPPAPGAQAARAASLGKSRPTPLRGVRS
jgi:hypothetical protein